jgi:hypothetical protein
MEPERLRRLGAGVHRVPGLPEGADDAHRPQ